MATTDELIKQLRERAKSGKRGSKTAEKALQNLCCCAYVNLLGMGWHL